MMETTQESIYSKVNPEVMPGLEEYPNNPATFGTSLKLLEDAKQLAICHMGFRFDSYLGWCGHHCSYCYARGHNMRYRRWDLEYFKIADLDQVKRYFVNAIEKKKTNNNVLENCIRHRYPIRVGTNTDCFQPAEKKYKITYSFITEIMNKYDYPYCICTKSALVADSEYLDTYQDNVTFQFTLSTLNQDILDKIERGAATALERLEAMRILSDRGYFVGCRVSPYIPEYMDDLELLVERLAEAGCKHVISELLRVTPILNKVMIEECGFDVVAHYQKMGAKYNTGYCRYPLGKKIEYQKYLKGLCDNYGMTFATCADEDPSFHTVNNCCGFDGLPNFDGCPKATYYTAFEICREKGSVGFEDLLNAGWCPEPKTLRTVWNKGYFENILMNLQFDPDTKEYRFVKCNPRLKKVNF